MNAPTDQPAPELHKLLESGRGTRVDWLDEDAPVDAIAATVAAMANTQGGTIFLGVSGDEGQITGVSDRLSTIDRILQAILALEPPLIIPMPRAQDLEDRPVITVQIPAGMPYLYAHDGRYLHREGPNNQALKPHELRRLLIERGEINFETEIAAGASLDDLNWDKVGAYVESMSGMGENDPKQVLVKRGCLTPQGDAFRPTHAGILLFGKDPQRFIRSAEITAVRFAGDTMSDTFSRQDITGTLPDQIRRAETFLVDHLRKGVKLQHTMTRQESFEYPMEAARELVVNAVAHRNYSISGDGIRLYIFKDRMEVSSPGGLPGPVTIANIKDERFSRNPAIVQVLSDMGFIERLGYGVDRVIELMRSQDLREPEFKETDGGFRVVLYNQATEEQKSADRPEINIELPAEYDGIAINPRQEAAIAYLQNPGNTRITNSELQRLFPDVHAETIRRDLADLVTKNILSKMGQKRGSYYILNKKVD